jgi:hypothetical protein
MPAVYRFAPPLALCLIALLTSLFDAHSVEAPRVQRALQFPQPTFWQEYGWVIILVFAICVLEAILIDRLLRERSVN